MDTIEYATFRYDTGFSRHQSEFGKMCQVLDAIWQQLQDKCNRDEQNPDQFTLSPPLLMHRVAYIQ